MIALTLALAAVQPSVAQPAVSTPAAPVPATAPIDPKRAAPAERIAARLLPSGVFATLMKSSMDMVSNSMSNQMFDMPLRDFVKMAGIDDTEAAKLGPATLKQIMEIFDPAFVERQRITMQVMGTEIGAFMTSMEPDYRAGLAESLAHRFDAKQLGEIDRFFATPVGSAYAGQSMLLYVDPAMMARLQNMMPRLMQSMPAIIKKVADATASLPKPRDPKSMTEEEKAKFKALLGPTTP